MGFGQGERPLGQHQEKTRKKPKDNCRAPVLRQGFEEEGIDRARCVDTGMPRQTERAASKKEETSENDPREGGTEESWIEKTTTV